MADMPPADVEIGSTVVERLLAEQFPDLAKHPLHSVTGGWDNVVLRLGTRMAVRLPRRAAAAPLAEHEHRWLPVLARGITTPIPAPLRIGKPTAYYPWSWSVVPWIEGSTSAGMPANARSALAPGLAAFLGELHTPAPPSAPQNPVRGGPLAGRDEAVQGRLRAGSVPHAGELLPLWERLRDTDPWHGVPIWLHGDLHPANLLMIDGHLSGVVDFGDVTAGDPATDLAVAWLAFDSDGRQAFLSGLPAAYRTDAALLARARGWALALATAFSAHSDDNPVMAAIGLHTIRELLEQSGP
jgi:aminoglycoside phosphotransferase (APT) family kinase protein